LNHFALDLLDYECIQDSIVDQAGSCGMAVWRNKGNEIRILSIKGTNPDRFTDVALDAGNCHFLPSFHRFQIL
jgi:hypothetical protein